MARDYFCLPSHIVLGLSRCALCEQVSLTSGLHCWSVFFYNFICYEPMMLSVVYTVNMCLKIAVASAALAHVSDQGSSCVRRAPASTNKRNPSKQRSWNYDYS